MRSVSVRFGIAPANYAEGDEGVAVGEVFDGTAAAEAGIRPGDRLTRWNGEPLLDVQHWMTFLSKHKPGDIVDVTAVRPKDPKDKNAGSEEIVVRVTLKARDQAAR
jgi:S1-C subfamily serine protease